jgi:hypothetical protein
MASKTSKAEPERNWGEPIDMEEFARKLAARRAELGNPPGTRNSGARRTASKRALLAEIDNLAAAKGFKW